jgi:hypothetical protein
MLWTIIAGWAGLNILAAVFLGLCGSRESVVQMEPVVRTRRVCLTWRREDSNRAIRAARLTAVPARLRPGIHPAWQARVA